MISFHWVSLSISGTSTLSQDTLSITSFIITSFLNFVSRHTPPNTLHCFIYKPKQTNYFITLSTRQNKPIASFFHPQAKTKQLLPCFIHEPKQTNCFTASSTSQNEPTASFLHPQAKTNQQLHSFIYQPTQSKETRGTPGI